LYPFPFKEHIVRNANTYQLDPFFVTAVMRQESIFDPVIESPVGAVGLMQIMPYTGEEIADDLGEAFVKDSLYRPAFNIRYGCYYLRKLMNQFKDDQLLAICGYNGGPKNARKWKRMNSNDEFDMFVENIGFSETRKYAKKVLGNYWTYKALAGPLKYTVAGL
ncbi:MAG: transglycosylase SLT domain-containing protein, partial [Chitinivibrionales bacterium]|nr:transglycosylase SLT domain-containing protein [Chitinivibrionales bacterium]